MIIPKSFYSSFRTRVKHLAFMMLALSPAVLFSQQQVNVAKMDSFLTVLADHHKMMVAVAISKGGEIVYSRATGYAKIDSVTKVPADVNTKYRIGSVTKTFTSVMIHQLVEEGKLSLGTTLDKFYPKLPNAKIITISHLLRHQSGLHNFTDDEVYMTYYTQPHTEKEMLVIIGSVKPDFEPGQKSSYSNSNYVLLGYIIEKVTKKTYSENLKTRIVDKIGLTNTYYGGPADIKKNEAFSYYYKNKKWNAELQTDMSVPGGAGAIVSTPSDLVKYIRALFTYQLLKKESVDEMVTMTNKYGAGMFEVPFYDIKGYGHTGGIDEFVSNLVYFPSEDLGIAYVTNGHSYAANELGLNLLKIYYEKEFTLPEFVEYNVSEAVLDTYLGSYHNDMMQLDMMVTREGTALIAEPSGQPGIELEAKSDKVFLHSEAGVEIEFFKNAEGKATHFMLKQGGMEFYFQKLK